MRSVQPRHGHRVSRVEFEHNFRVRVDPVLCSIRSFRACQQLDSTRLSIERKISRSIHSMSSKASTRLDSKCLKCSKLYCIKIKVEQYKCLINHRNMLWHIILVQELCAFSISIWCFWHIYHVSGH